MQKARRIAAVAVLTLAAVAIGLWMARDQPRRIIESSLAERLGAEVSVGSLHFDGLSAVRLGQVVIRMHAAPGLREVRIGEIETRGAIGEMAKGRFQSVRLTGVEVVVDPAAGAVWPTADETATSAEVGRLDITEGRLTVLSSDGDSVVDFAAGLTDLGGVPVGTVAFAGDRIQLEPLLRLAGRTVPDGLQRTHADGLSGELRLTAETPRFEVDAVASRIVVADRPVETVARLECVVFEEAPGLLRVKVVPSLSSVGEVRFEATVATSPWRVTWLQVLVKDLDAVAWSQPPVALPESWDVVGGTIDLELDGEPVGGFTVDMAAHDVDIAGPLSVRANLSGNGRLRIDESRDPIGQLELTGRVARLPSVAAPSSVLDAVLPATLAASVEAAGGGQPLSGSLRVATAEVSDLEVTGAAGLAAPVTLDARWTWGGGDLGGLVDRLAAGGMAVIPGGITVAGEVGAQGRFRGDLAALTVSGEVRVRDLAVRSGGAAAAGAGTWQLRGEEPVADFSWSSAAPAIEIEMPETPMTATVEPLDPLPVALQADATVDLTSGAARLRQVVADAGSLGVARLEGEWEPTAAADFRLAASIADLGSWLPRVAPVVGDSLREANASGRLTLELEAIRDEAGWSFSGPIDVAGAGLSSADGSRVIEGLEASTRVSGTATSEGTLKAKAAATVGGFQLLWGTHYADFSDHHAVVDVNTDRGPGGDATVDLRLDLPPQAWLAGTYRIAADAAPVWEGSLSIADIGEFWTRYVGAPFQGTLGAADGLLVESGELTTRLSGAVGEVVTATGEIRLDGLSIASADDTLHMENLRFRLPVDVGWAQGGGVELRETRRGSLGFDRADVGGAELPATVTELEVLGDTIKLIGSLVIPFLRGEVALEGVELAELARPSRHLAASVGLHGISLTEVAGAVGLPPLEGDVSGRFPRVRFGDGVLTVDGTGELSLFGGTVTVSGIAGSDLLTRYPRLKFSAEWRGIDLAQVTHTFDFGAISGIVEGQLADCELFRDVPLGFRGSLRSVPTKGVKQRISLKAVNNIAIVGTGTGLGFIDRGIHRFIRSYSYQGIGIEMVLSEDHFLLRGLERRGERELFVMGGFPLRLDVVNVEPGKTVSFRTMIQRLRNLDVTASTNQP
jgi:hypothetical protein